MKIDLDKWFKALSHHLVVKEVLDFPKAKEVLEYLIEYTNTHLQCNTCGNILPDEWFYKQSVQIARRKRHQTCKECHKKVYGKKIRS